MKHCSRCGGYGIIKSYSNIKGGVCFKCDGKNTRGNWKEEEKAEKKARLERNKRLNELENKIYNNEKTLALFDQYPPETEEEKQFHQKKKDRLKEYKKEYNELAKGQNRAIYKI